MLVDELLPSLALVRLLLYHMHPASRIPEQSLTSPTLLPQFLLIDEDPVEGAKTVLNSDT